jgi:hypothetical protein
MSIDQLENLVPVTVVTQTEDVDAGQNVRDNAMVDSRGILRTGPGSSEFIERRILEYNTPPINSCELATHWVYVINEEYNFFQRQECVVLFSDFPYNQHEIVDYLSHKTNVRVVEDTIGRNGEYYRIEALDENCNVVSAGIVHIDNLRAIPGAPTLPTSLERCRDSTISQRTSSIFKRSWYNTPGPYFDSDKCKYYINVRTIHFDTRGLDSKKESARIFGIRSLAEYYSKDTKFMRANPLYLSDKRFAQVEEWYINPDRPGANLQFLVGIPAKYFDAIPEEEVLPRAVEGEKNGVSRVAVYKSSDIRRQISLVAGLFRSIQEENLLWEVDRYRYTGPAAAGLGIINFSKEASRLESLFATIQKILNLNGNPLNEDHDHRLEIGYSLDFNIRYIFYDDGSGSRNMRKGFLYHLSKEPMNLSRTCAYLFYLFEIEEYYSRGASIDSYKKLLRSYTYPLPDMRPTSNKCLESFSNALDCSLSGENDLLKTYRKNRKNKLQQNGKARNKFTVNRQRGSRRQEDVELFIGADDNYDKKFEPVKTIKAIRLEEVDVQGLQKIMDPKMDAHYDKVSENLAALLIDILKQFKASISFGEISMKDFNIAFSKMISSFPDIRDLSIDMHQELCLNLDIAKSAIENLGYQQDQGDRSEFDAQVIAIEALKEVVSCGDVCKAVPVACGNLNISFPPRIELPELPTVDIERAFYQQVEKMAISTIADNLATMGINILEENMTNGKNFLSDDFNFKNNFTNRLDADLNVDEIETALVQAEVNIFDAPDGGDEIDVDADIETSIETGLGEDRPPVNLGPDRPPGNLGPGQNFFDDFNF